MAVSHVKTDTIGDAAGVVTFWWGATTSSANATDLVRPSDWNSVHNQYYTLSGNTTNASTASGTNVVLQAAGQITLVGSTNTIIISGQGPQSLYWFPQVLNNTNTMSVGGGSSIFVQPFDLDHDMSVSFIRIPVTMSIVTTTFSTQAGAYGTSAAQSNTLWLNIYSQGTGANAQRLQFVAQASKSYVYQISFSGTSSTHSVSYNFTVPTISGGDSNMQFTTNRAAGSSAVNIAPANTSDFLSYRFFDVPFATSLSAGDYWIAIQRSSTTGGSAVNINLGMSAMVVTQHNSSFGFPGSASNSSFVLQAGLGLWSTNTLGTTTSSIGLSSISSLASYPLMYFEMHRSA